MTRKRTGTPWLTPTRGIDPDGAERRDFGGYPFAVNRLSDDVLVVPIFSHGADGPTHVRVERGIGGLRKDGVLFCEELTTLDRDFLARGPWGPAVPGDVLTAVIRAVRRALGEAVAEPS